MKVAFYGVSRGIGTSANMQILKHIFSAQNKSVSFTDISEYKGKELEEKISSYHLLVINTSLTDSDFLEFYLRHSVARKNILFLIGKNFHEEKECRRFAKSYRIDAARICTIPYNMRFQTAYDKGKLYDFLMKEIKNGDSTETVFFRKNLKEAADAILKFGENERSNIL